tara:strand:- start:283 stop:510 length:228 start_codon:yes stop_codon:yes gene_type:complete
MKAKEEWVEYIKTLHLQNNTEKHDFDKAFRFGIESAVEEMLEYTNQRVIEELERAKTTKSWFYINDRIKELKQER